MSKAPLDPCDQINFLSHDGNAGEHNSYRHTWLKRFELLHNIQKPPMHLHNREILRSLALRESAMSGRNKTGIPRRMLYFARAAIALLAFGIGSYTVNFWGPQWTTPQTNTIRFSQAVNTVSPGLFYGELSQKTPGIADARTRIFLQNETVSTNLSTDIHSLTSSLRIVPFREGVGFYVFDGEMVLNFHPAGNLKRYILFPDGEAVTITGTEVYAQVNPAGKKIYLRHGRAVLESANGKTMSLKPGYLYTSAAGAVRPVSFAQDKELARRFGIKTAREEVISGQRAERFVKISFESWLAESADKSGEQLKPLLTRYRHVYKVFLTGQNTAYLGQNGKTGSVYYSGKYEIDVPKEAIQRLIRLK